MTIIKKLYDSLFGKEVSPTLLIRFKELENHISNINLLFQNDNYNEYIKVSWTDINTFSLKLVKYRLLIESKEKLPSLPTMVVISILEFFTVDGSYLDERKSLADFIRISIEFLIIYDNKVDTEYLNSLGMQLPTVIGQMEDILEVLEKIIITNL